MNPRSNTRKSAKKNREARLRNIKARSQKYRSMLRKSEDESAEEPERLKLGWRSWLLLLAALGIITPFLVILALADDSEPIGGLEVGTVAPLIEGETIHGENFNLDNHRDKWVVVNFFASWCAPCEKEHPEFVSFYSPGRLDKVQLVSVVFNETESKAVKFFEDRGGDWPVLGRETGQIAVSYGITSVPETYLLAPSPNGRGVHKVAAHWKGEINEATLVDEICKIYEGVDFSVDPTVAAFLAQLESAGANIDDINLTCLDLPVILR